MPGPLDGFRIIDLTQMISGPMATMILADQGADVIKVEPPANGDLTRLMGGRKRGMYPRPSPSPTATSAFRVVIDLKQPRGLAVLKQLVAMADVVVQNFRPGVPPNASVSATTRSRREIRLRSDLCLDQRLRRKRSIRSQTKLTTRSSRRSPA